ncbi:FecR domain-containing protein [Rhodopirellula sp. JC740]|uniref:FecR domain-containing protein n=1 Tax=Rhodopirellula halodulae TaxID=2894198 RepID=A0ABS8NLD9_9BACT|nr:LamG-like jellyroll fold domain-containing protein [Rhodopirellula sp. JC740]MCC9644373.1 FecR domain-containing protein [Rhodopirellula sp. JC740]
MNRDQRLAAWLEDELDSDGHEKLLCDLLSDESYTQEATQQLQMRRLLGSQAIDEKEFTRELLLKVQSVDEASDVPSTERAILSRLQLRRRWQRSAVAAVAVAAAAAIFLLVIFRPTPTTTPTVRVLAAEGVQSLDGRALEEGRLVTIKGGILELELGSESRLVLEAPAEFAIESASVVRLVSGRCYAEMEKGTAGLRIKTPSGEVLDLGTRFGVEVTRSEGTSVHVFEGEVELAIPENRSVLREGEGARWTASSELKPIEVEAERFISRLPGSERRTTKWLHWPFDERDGNATNPRGEWFPKDMDAAQLHGAQWIEREGSGALEFDGIDDWVETTFAGIGADADRTVAAWIKLAPDFGKKNGQAIVGWGDFSILDPHRRIGAAWELGVGDTSKPVDVFGRIKVAIGGPLTVGHADLRDGQWHHVAAVYLSQGAPNGQGIVLLYVDGQLQHRTFGRSVVRLDTDVKTSKSEPVQFGRQVMRATPRREYFKGAIDDVFIINRALSGDELRALRQTNEIP